MVPPYLNQLLADATGVESENGPLTLTIEPIGSVSFPSGQVVACDATDPVASLPFARQVDPGNWPVFLTGARLPDGDDFIAAAWLRFQDGVPVRWEPANWKGQNPRRHPDPAYPVDSSIGAFMSPEAARVLAERRNLVDLVQRPFESESPPAGVVLEVPGARHLSFAVFSPTGFGDGVYGSWWGLDATDHPLCLLTDFHVAGFPEKEPAPSPPWWRFWRRT
jgi:hypothetical protein